MNCETALPAFSIKVSEGTPKRSVVARSISRISAAVVIFMLATGVARILAKLCDLDRQGNS
jgi:hypothetical protein